VKAYVTHRNVAFAMAVLIGLCAFAGSARELWRIADTAHYGLPVGLVAALDGLAVVCVIVLARRRDWQALGALIAATLLSVGLQVLAVPRTELVEGTTVAVSLDRYVSAVLVHALVPLASFMAVHLATRLDRPGPGKPKSAPKPLKPAPSAPRPVTAPVSPTPIRPKTEPQRPAAGIGELVALAHEVAAELGKPPADLSRTELQDGIKNHPSRAGRGIGTKKAGEVLDELRTPPAPDLEVVR
jgi:hypothetical protein